VAEKRNAALSAVTGEYFAWFDDDDWSGPNRLAALRDLMDGRAAFAGPRAAWFFDATVRRATRYQAGSPIFNGALYAKDCAEVAFDPKLRRASDTDWLRRLGQRLGSGAVVEAELFFWVCHGTNLSNPRPRPGRVLAEEAFAAHFGNDWGDTSARLDDFRAMRVGAPTGGAIPGPRLPVVRASWSGAPLVEKSQRVEAPRSTANRADAQRARVSVVVPIRDRAGARVQNLLRSLAWQTVAAAEVLVVSHGSSAGIEAELAELCASAQAKLLCVGHSREPWCKPLALNTGIRASIESSDYIMTVDADMILDPKLLDASVSVLEQNPRSLVLCQSSDLPPGQERLVDLTELPALHATSRLRGQHGCGGIQVASRQFFFDVRGYDETLRWWGAEDLDMVSRSRAAGMEVVWLDRRNFILHQWHPQRESVLDDPQLRDDARRAWATNHQIVRARSGLTKRNPDGWGGIGVGPPWLAEVDVT
jgi:glycosyltransferase involved in cell wall biosynthesis